ncbi:hypothetical protein ELI15_17285 [Rhizobium ruizarguesonis]|uniref:hypothetical protein n=1 Tax=Rhizobium leguminosarum TaxID=384 RepID=UPI00102F4D9C|nr:hypothetical protein [Rhizobium leguminosarum]TAU52489.1 hypothetical protein ELI43_06485 [Rhizobium leguminosarum]TAW53284.1 hypothetical protein ELI14_19265 [Rhizobium leguminosarum]TAW66013.1 hypothetical protein ELI15_17285 [Rhizobium ruizarguesonis]
MSSDPTLTGESTNPKPAEARYEVREDAEETWQIVDTANGLPAATNGRDLVQLVHKDAIELAKELNDCEQGGLESPLI